MLGIVDAPALEKYHAPINCREASMPKAKQDLSIRLQKFIADCGFTSRRKAEDLITQGKVKVNGETVTILGTKVTPGTDLVEIDGTPLDPQTVQKVYIVLNKPRGCVTTLSDPEGRPTVMEYCHEITERIYPVGRLDYLSEGLLILTNDGELANLVMHPRYSIIKTYEVKIFGSVTMNILEKLRAGVKLEDGFVKPKSVRVIEQLPGKTWVEFRIGEGKNREIRRMCEALGLTIDKLRRVAIEGLSIDDIRPGQYKILTKRELLNALGIDKNGVKKDSTKTYVSTRKSVDLKKKKFQQLTATPADDERFHKFRKETYFSTAKTIQEKKKLLDGVDKKIPKKRTTKKF